MEIINDLHKMMAARREKINWLNISYPLTFTIRLKLTDCIVFDSYIASVALVREGSKL